MESVGAFLNEEWDSLSKFFSNEDSDNFLLQVSNLFSNDEIPSNFDENPFSNQREGVHFHHDQAKYTIESMDFDTMCYNNGHVFVEDAIEETVQLNSELNEEFLSAEDSCKDKLDLNKSSEHPKKRSQVTKTANAHRRIKPRKNKKRIQNEEQNNDGSANGQSSSTCSSEEASNPSQDLNGESLHESKELQKSNGKTRTGRRSATDPQSLYARRRRERINERLKILQHIVPNGTKIDLSTMLEEAVHYVKFLQLQIKLLSSDEMWMCAPIAYNGMDIGFYQNTIVPNLMSLRN